MRWFLGDPSQPIAPCGRTGSRLTNGREALAVGHALRYWTVRRGFAHPACWMAAMIAIKTAEGEGEERNNRCG